MDAVSDLLAQRSAATAGLERMIGWSATAHVVLFALVTVAPAGWLSVSSDDDPEPIIMIDLPGTVGPPTDGFTPAASRPVPAERPVPAQRSAPRPPKALPREETRPAAAAVAETGTRRDASGLTTGGAGSGAELDVSDFCCPEYIATMRELIQRNWIVKQDVAGTTVMKFTIERDGRLTAIEREKSSGQPVLDLMSERALLLTGQLPPLPAAYTQPTLTVHMTFEYIR